MNALTLFQRQGEGALPPADIWEKVHFHCTSFYSHFFDRVVYVEKRGDHLRFEQRHHHFYRITSLVLATVYVASLAIPQMGMALLASAVIITSITMIVGLIAKHFSKSYGEISQRYENSLKIPSKKVPFYLYQFPPLYIECTYRQKQWRACLNWIEEVVNGPSMQWMEVENFQDLFSKLIDFFPSHPLRKENVQLNDEWKEYAFPKPPDAENIEFLLTGFFTQLSTALKNHERPVDRTAAFIHRSLRTIFPIHNPHQNCLDDFFRMNTLVATLFTNIYLLKNDQPPLMSVPDLDHYDPLTYEKNFCEHFAKEISERINLVNRCIETSKEETTLFIRDLEELKKKRLG